MQKMRTLLAFAVMLALSSTVLGQMFLTPVNSLTGDATTVTNDGEEISGDIRSAVFGSRGLKSFTIKDAAGTKHKFKAEDIASLKVKVDGLAKFEMIAEKSVSVKKMVEADFDEMADREYIYYEKVQVPGKDKYVLAQLLNPGWDSKIKVYNNPLGGETQSVGVAGVALVGGEDKTYLVVANGEPSMILKKKHYDKLFPELFASCREIGDNFRDKEAKFKYFAQHVFAYEVGCE
ncbi:MAG: hypothetical protein AAFQ68_21210 [Bacteroidota bacterium]